MTTGGLAAAGYGVYRAGNAVANAARQGAQMSGPEQQYYARE